MRKNSAKHTILMLILGLLLVSSIICNIYQRHIISDLNRNLQTEKQENENLNHTVEEYSKLLYKNGISIFGTADDILQEFS